MLTKERLVLSEVDGRFGDPENECRLVMCFCSRLRQASDVFVDQNGEIKQIIYRKVAEGN